MFIFVEAAWAEGCAEGNFMFGEASDDDGGDTGFSAIFGFTELDVAV